MQPTPPPAPPADPDGLSPLQRLFARLDAALTGKAPDQVLHTARTRRVTAENLLDGRGDRLYYLSDGGYSRVGVSVLDDDLPLFLTSNSRPAVRERWAGCAELVAEIEAELRRQWRALGWLDED